MRIGGREKQGEVTQVYGLSLEGFTKKGVVIDTYSLWTDELESPDIEFPSTHFGLQVPGT